MRMIPLITTPDEVDLSHDQHATTTRAGHVQPLRGLLFQDKYIYIYIYMRIRPHRSYKMPSSLHSNSHSEGAMMAEDLQQSFFHNQTPSRVGVVTVS